MASTSTVTTVDVWLDIVCPWCWIGTRNLAAALDRLPRADRVEVHWRAFELGPGGPERPGRRLAEVMRTEWGFDEEQAAALVARVKAGGRAAGLDLDPENVRPFGTFDAHRVVRLASGHGVAGPVLERLFHAYNIEHADLGGRDVLTSLAAEAGLDPAATEEMWRTGAHADDVRRDRELAAEAGVTGVPSYRVNGGKAVSGALGPDELLSLLREADHG
ncbi:DsbA family oxidoreductase [Nocardiopsis composta]|uniref:Putative DsbA family dithiol-disulfide isomerase n=1 Tax=Nocardiopsis composta TaxID=157465 RepID=A0A7W8VFC1_9ACTN|nr:DsbA family oxidoreductase [Nocardiopsis composta]MBB5433809.1 putative DsbA family dithiol-disulfide isomerase [Nocardiopsis composta]